MECSTSNFPPRPNVTEPDWWHVWKPLALMQGQEDLESATHAGREQPGATSVVPRCVREFVEDFTLYSNGLEPKLISVRPEDQGRYVTYN